MLSKKAEHLKLHLNKKEGLARVPYFQVCGIISQSFESGNGLCISKEYDEGQCCGGVMRRGMKSQMGQKGRSSGTCGSL